MIITHKLDEFLKELFPSVFEGEEVNLEKLKIQLQDYYSYNGNKPEILIEGDYVTIIIDTAKIFANESEYKKVINLCEKGRMNEAKPLLKSLIEKDPTNSEYYRILGQIHSEEGDQSEAINHLIDALCWDPNNKWALIMMGNIFARHKDDITTAIKYYDQAVVIDPTNNIALNNIGATLMEKGKVTEAKKYFNQALAISPSYPNTHFALSMVFEAEGNLFEAFEKAIETIKLCNGNNPLYGHAFNQAMSISKKIILKNDISKIVDDYRSMLEVRSGVTINLAEDSSIPTVAKLEVAENYDRNYHIVKYKADRSAYHHLIMHELVHLDLILQARNIGENRLYITNQENKRKYISTLEKDADRLHKLGYSSSVVANLMSELFDGLNRQIFNTPIDLFIEDFLYQSYPTLRPYQFVSMLAINKEGVDAVTNKKVLDLIPRSVLRVSKIYNIINVMGFESLFGVNLLPEIKADKSEMDEAIKLWDEFLEYRTDREPAEEYELVQNWGEDLKMGAYFELPLETDFRKKSQNPFSILEDIENDPFNLQYNEDREKKIKEFQEAHTGEDINISVAMYMVEALGRFSGKTKNEIQPIAFEIAMIGTTGISPDKNGYKVSKIPNTNFSGYHLLAYYYVTWKLYDPTMHKTLGLPFDREYELAQNLFNNLA